VTLDEAVELVSLLLPRISLHVPGVGFDVAEKQRKTGPSQRDGIRLAQGIRLKLGVGVDEQSAARHPAFGDWQARQVSMLASLYADLLLDRVDQVEAVVACELEDLLFRSHEEQLGTGSRRVVG